MLNINPSKAIENENIKIRVKIKIASDPEFPTGTKYLIDLLV